MKKFDHILTTIVEVAKYEKLSDDPIACEPSLQLRRFVREWLIPRKKLFMKERLLRRAVVVMNNDSMNALFHKAIMRLRGGLCVVIEAEPPIDVRRFVRNWLKSRGFDVSSCLPVVVTSSNADLSPIRVARLRAHHIQVGARWLAKNCPEALPWLAECALGGY